MSILEELKKRVQEIKTSYESLSVQNSEFQAQVTTLLKTQKEKDETIELLTYELQEKEKELQALLIELNKITSTKEHKEERA